MLERSRKICQHCLSAWQRHTREHAVQLLEERVSQLEANFVHNTFISNPFRLAELQSSSSSDDEDDASCASSTARYPRTVPEADDYNDDVPSQPMARSLSTTEQKIVGSTCYPASLQASCARAPA